MPVEVTDPARELARLAEQFAGMPGKGQSIVAIFGHVVGVSLDSAEFHDVLGALHRRITELESLISEVDDFSLDKEERNLIAGAARQFREFLHPRHAHEAWETAAKTMLAPQNITALRMFSPAARRLRPLRVVADTDRDAAIQRLQEAIDTIESDAGLEKWAKSAAVTGLRQIEIVLRYLKFFGHEAAIEALFATHQKIVAVVATVPESAKQPLWTALQRIALIGALFALPNQLLTALERYENWPNKVLAYIADNSPTERRLLPPPDSAALKPNEPEETTPAK